jgi:hypothetical protein
MITTLAASKKFLQLKFQKTKNKKKTFELKAQENYHITKLKH